MEKLKTIIRKMVKEEGFSKGSRKDKEATKSRSTVLGMTQVEEEEAPSFDMSKTSDRGDGNFPSGNLKESTIKNIIRQAIIEEAKNWPLMESDVYAIVDKFNEKKQDYDQVYFKDNDLKKVLKHKKTLKPSLWDKYKMQIIKVKTNGKMSVVEGIEEAKLKRFKVFVDGEKEPLILTGKNENDVKKFAHQMIQNNKVKIRKVVKEAITESLKGKFVVASIYGDLYTPKAVSEKKALKLMMKIADQYAGDNVFMLGAEHWNTHKFNKKNKMVEEDYKRYDKDGNELDKNGVPIKEAKRIKYKKNDWKKYNKLAKKKDVMIQTAFGDLFKWEDGSNYGVFGSEEDGREIELDHDDIDIVMIEGKLNERRPPKDEFFLNQVTIASKAVGELLRIFPKTSFGKDKNYLKMLKMIDKELVNNTKKILGYNESVNEGKLSEIEDHEGSMAKSQLERSMKYSKMIYDMINNVGQGGEVEFPAWVQSKLTKSMDYLQSVFNYLDGKDGIEDKFQTTKLGEDEKKKKRKVLLSKLKDGKLNEKMDRKKAAIILKQIGGNKFIAMTGAKGFAFSDKYMSFKIGKNSKGINFVRIGHNAKDLYDMEFGFVSVRGIKVKKKVKDVYADMLGTMFEKYTGMRTSL